MVKKAQIKIQQMVFMLVAVTLFFALVAMFIIMIKFSGLNEDATRLEEKNAMLLATKLANSPEFSCGQVFGGDKTNCIDEDKIMVLKNNMIDYVGFWGKDISNIEIRIIYPVEETILCTAGNYPNCNVIRLFSDEVAGYGQPNFVSLCRKENIEGEIVDKCEIAKLTINYESTK